ncbi:MAG: putative zinc-binding metallopeptidase [Acidobacteria bacterium]|nr:putative zinc-binding metallopeptidase [Acidobacteriota bacterium]
MRSGFRWHDITDEGLLDTRICDLPLKIKGKPLEKRVRRVYLELQAKGVQFEPHVWLSSEWFSPDGVPGFAIPFYLAHPRLIRLERKEMLEVEGGTELEFLRITRHEVGHALNNAFRLHLRRQWRKLFGPYGRPYPDFYRPEPNSRDFVLHLKAWYAQVHPAEDFAETFAVWLTPGSDWRRRYQGWPALRKLEYVDELMQEIQGKSPEIRRRKNIEKLSEITMTLREHYARKRQHYAFEWPDFYDRDLRRIFSWEPYSNSKPPASTFLRRFRRELVRLVAEGTGVHRYAVNHVYEDLIGRCRQLRLSMVESDAITREQVMVLLTMHTMRLLHSGYHRIAV